ncbi:MAG: F-box protein [Parachlamydiaceae bacterium]|nr:F-box protein [Parachlamydiaceae bacterium]
MQSSSISANKNRWEFFKSKLKPNQKTSSISSVQRPVTQYPVISSLIIGEDLISRLNSDQFSEIFSSLNLSMLGKGCQVSKKWNQVLNQDSVWKHMVYKHKAIGPEWLQKLGKDVVTDEDCQEAFCSLSLEIIEKLKRLCEAIPGKYIVETHTLVWMPKTICGQPINEKNLGIFLQSRFPNTDNGYRYILPLLLDPSRQPIDNSYWMLMLGVLPESKNTTSAQRQDILENLTKKAQMAYRLPKPIEVAVAAFAKYCTSGVRLFKGKWPSSYTFCAEWGKDYQVTTGSFFKTGFALVNSDGNDANRYIGIAPVYIFDKPQLLHKDDHKV